MKPGQEVGYVDGDGNRQMAKVVAVTGKGASNYKTLTLRIRQDGKDADVQGVPYRADADEGGAFWVQKGERLDSEPSRMDQPRVGFGTTGGAPPKVVPTLQEVGLVAAGPAAAAPAPLAATAAPVATGTPPAPRAPVTSGRARPGK